jgi:short-subunit dehydrogenase
MTHYPHPTSILITGASSGIGEGLALHYAAPGVTLFLNGRSNERLQAVAEACREKGAEAYGEVVDVTDDDAMKNWIVASDAKAPLNLVIANAGVAAGTNTVEELHDAAVGCYDINVHGVFNTVHPALTEMAKRPYPVQDAQIGIVSSVMGYVGTARSPAYSSSKAAMKSYGQALRGKFRGMGIGVTVICPGYVRSRLMGPDMKGFPFMIEVDEAAGTIARALARNKARITFPWQVLLLARIAINLPGFLADRVNKPWGVKPLEEN